MLGFTVPPHRTRGRGCRWRPPSPRAAAVCLLLVVAAAAALSAAPPVAAAVVTAVDPARARAAAWPAPSPSPDSDAEAAAAAAAAAAKAEAAADRATWHLALLMLLMAAVLTWYTPPPSPPPSPGMTYGAVAEDTYEGLLALGDAVGSVPRGLSAAQIAALPTWVVGKGTGGGGDGGGDGGGGGGGEGDEAASPAASSSTTAGSGSGRIKCAICLEAAVPGDVLRTLPCVHSFHQVCVDVWLGVRDTCPLCKARVRGEG